MYSWLASGPSRLGVFVGSFHLLWFAQSVANFRYFGSDVSRYASMSPLMNKALNQVASAGLACPAIQWSAAARIGASQVAADAGAGTLTRPAMATAATAGAMNFTCSSCWDSEARGGPG